PQGVGANLFANCRGPAAKPATSVVPDVPYVTVSLSVPDSSRTSSLPRPPGRSPISGPAQRVSLSPRHQP
ncbi:hypothetical protein DNF23_53095, partial [Pseudomonas syringae pv. pisi]